jgi:periplasmic protein TonB
MLNQLIESKNHHAENTRKNGFLLTTLGVLVAVLVGGWTYSLFAKSFGMGTGDFELSRLVAPVAPSEDPPPPPEPEHNNERRQTTDNERPTVIERVAPIENSLDKPPKLEESRKLVSDPLKPSEWDKYSEGTENKYRSTDSDQNEPGNGGGIKQPTTAKTDDEEDKAPEVVVKPSPAPTVKINNRPVSKGVLNGQASYLAKPPYPPAARAMGVTGAVNVQILIDEKGNVVSAVAASGHPLLRAVSESAARQSKFTPTRLSDQPVKVTGFIIYQFKP